jgi:Zn-dependent protease
MKSKNTLLSDPRSPGEMVFTRIGETPVTSRGISWIPITQFLAWVFFTHQASRRKPADTFFHWAGEGILKTAVSLGAEWCHNLAHLMVSNWIAKPMDQFRIQFGMPRCIYYQLNDQEVSPREHVLRSLGGPAINLILLPFSWLSKRVTKPGTVPGEAAKLLYQTNIFLSLVSLLPIPGIDGGPILKWSLVERGCSVEEADLAVRKTNGPLAVGLGLFSSYSFSRKWIFAGFISALLGLTSLSIFAGWLKEDDVPI